MPRLGDITVRIEPAKDEDIPSVTLIRRDKQWIIQEADGNIRGLFFGEIRLAHTLCEVISNYANAGIKGTKECQNKTSS